MRDILRPILGIAFLGLIPACFGPCVESYAEDVLFLEAVYDAETGAPLDEVVLTEVRIGDVAFEPSGGEGLTPLGDGAVRCMLPCSIGSNREGTYEIDLSADGYEATTITVEAAYAGYEGGCPSYNTDGTRATATLRPL